MKRCLAAAQLVLAVFALAGIWDNVTLNQRLMVVGVGVDPGSAAGRVRVTFQFPTPAALEGIPTGSGGGPAQHPFLTATREGTSFIDALEQVQNEEARDVYLGQLQYILLNVHLRPPVLPDLIQELERTPEIDQTQYVVMTLEPTPHLLKLSPPTTVLPAVFIADRFRCERCITVQNRVRGVDVLRMTRTPLGDIAIPVITARGAQGFEFTRLAILSRGRVAAVLNPADSLAVAYLKGLVRKGDLWVPGPWPQPAVLRSVADAAQVRALPPRAGRPVFVIDLHVDAEVDRSPVRVLTSDAYRTIAGRAAARLQRQAAQVMSWLDAHDLDPVGLERAMLVTWPQRFVDDAHFRHLLPRSEVTVRVHVSLHRGGELI